MLALQAITPERLAAAVPAITLAEARKLIAQVHRGEPIAPTSRDPAGGGRRPCGRRASVPALERDRGDAERDRSVREVPARGAGRRAVRDRAHPARASRTVHACASARRSAARSRARSARPAGSACTRNLAAWEIVEQVRVVRARLPRGRVHGVVFQGMGEPLANLDEVLAAIAVLTEPCALGIDARAITVCTAGLPGGIRRLAREAPKVRLGAVDPQRDRRAAQFADADRAGARARRGARRRGRARARSPGSRRCGRSRCSPASTTPTTTPARSPSARARSRHATGTPPAALDHRVQRDRRPTIRSSARRARAAFRAALGLPSHRRYSGGVTSPLRAVSSPLRT